MHGYRPTPPAARQVTHILVGAIVCAGLAFVTLVLGGLWVSEAVDNPAPTRVRCEERALRSVALDTWVELTDCDLDIERAFELETNERITRFYVPLVVPETGALVGVFETHDPALLRALEQTRHQHSLEADQAVAERLGALLSPPYRGFTTKAGYGEQGIYRYLPEFGPADVLLEHGREPRTTLGVASVAMGLVLLLSALVFALRVRKSWAADAADLAAWRAQHHVPAQPWVG